MTSESESKVDLIGEPGAYISDNGARSAGEVRAENNCLMLSVWTCVVCNDDWRAMRKDVDGDDVLVGPWKLLQVNFRKRYRMQIKLM